jgi:hypothetical protein
VFERILKISQEGNPQPDLAFKFSNLLNFESELCPVQVRTDFRTELIQNKFLTQETMAINAQQAPSGGFNETASLF